MTLVVVIATCAAQRETQHEHRGPHLGDFILSTAAWTVAAECYWQALSVHMLDSQSSLRAQGWLAAPV